MRPEDLEKLREKAEAAADECGSAKAARAAFDRHMKGVDLDGLPGGPTTKVFESWQAPESHLLAEIRAAHDKVRFDVTDLEPRPVVVVPAPESEMVGHIAAMRKELAASNQREAASAKRAEEAEDRERETQRRTERRERWLVASAALALILAAPPLALLIF
jgi:hypothetical protein